MKKSISIFILLFCASFCYSQNRDNVWMLGYNVGGNLDRCGIDFTGGIPDTFSVESAMEFFITDASICDTNSNLLFYTNGQWIGNANFDTLLNSENFNSGWATDSFYTSGLGFTQGAIAIPFPNTSSKYYLFYITGENLFPYHLAFDTTTYYDGQPFHLSYSVIDMNLDGGLGGIDPLFKNVHAVDDTLLLGRITACKHANGRDWWIITHKWYSDVFYKFLISPEGVSTPILQNEGPVFLPSDGLRDFDVRGQALFSPDGSKYATLDQSNILHLFDFDRCSGNLSNYKEAKIDTSTGRMVACSFSPNSRFIYASGLYNLYQYDTWSPDLEASGVLIAQWDSFVEPLANIPTWFFNSQIGPDNKIYLSTFGTTPYIHVINLPDLLGQACNFRQHSLQLSNYNQAIPNFPNYNLGALTGSVCDTLTAVNSISKTFSISVYPNPAKDCFTINYDFQTLNKVEFILYNSLGEPVLRKILLGDLKTLVINSENLPNGIYYYHISYHETVIYNGKISLIK